MSKKHFIIIALALRNAHASDTVCQTVANALRSISASFDKERFLEACRDV